MLNQLKFYFLMFGVVALIGLGAATKYLYDQNASLKDEVTQLQASKEKAKENLTLVSAQLIAERQTRLITEQALKDIPDVVYTQELPPAVRNVLTDFRDRMQ